MISEAGQGVVKILCEDGIETLEQKLVFTHPPLRLRYGGVPENGFL